MPGMNTAPLMSELQALSDALVVVFALGFTCGCVFGWFARSGYLSFKAGRWLRGKR